MTQGVKDLIDAIASGDSLAIDAAFNTEMATRISDRLDDMRVEVAQNMFQTEELDEANVALFMGKYQVKHNGEHVATYVSKTEAKEHAEQLNYEKKNALSTKKRNNESVEFTLEDYSIEDLEDFT